jgi:hypothetical protein
MKFALVVIATCIVTYFAAGTASSGTAQIKSRSAVIEAALSK